jgi:hypothetical protein
MSNRVADHRARMKQRGYKEVRYWVPDTASPEFARRIRDEATALNEADSASRQQRSWTKFQADVLDRQ